MELQLDGVTFVGPAWRGGDPALLERLPARLRTLLEQVNGFVAFRGGLHVRGMCSGPVWHSLEAAWTGPFAIHRLFPTVLPDDVPFAQDCMGDQFLLREGRVLRLMAELGELEAVGKMDLVDFLHTAKVHPLETLQLQPLQRFEAEGQTLRPGELLAASPSFSSADAARGVQLRAMAMRERLELLSLSARCQAGDSDAA
jgi:hypothetical protein